MQSPNPPINPPSFRSHYSSNTNYIISYTMAKFSLVFAAAGVLLVAMVAVAEASTIYTTTTFEENPRGRSGTGSDCYQRMMDQDMLSQCGMYLMKNLQGGRRQGVRSAGEEKEMCCMQLRNLGSNDGPDDEHGSEPAHTMQSHDVPTMPNASRLVLDILHGYLFKSPSLRRPPSSPPPPPLKRTPGRNWIRLLSADNGSGYAEPLPDVPHKKC
ncbi:hypothetical protein L1987_85171 [Smallanthus sonchifolius]|uniref:Uncharacterized protein n=1 Tax=Smallanthus sonchifolius TaxID=185202 RepID=A0ACB8XWD8_9ASTR|nr:hypothetical protein L1987_85171 [Smallanthus sonchifolius]